MLLSSVNYDLRSSLILHPSDRVMVTTMMWLFDIARAEGDNSELDQFAETGSR